MFEGIDASLFPVLKTRRALVIVDAQNDFLSPDGALQVDVPDDLSGRIVRLVQGFRPYGDIVWIRSEYGQPRPIKNEQIITSDAPAAGSRRSPKSRGRRPSTSISEQPPSRCPEAFLSGPAPGRPECVRKDSHGAQFPANFQGHVEKKDMSFVKTQYSAFQIPDLIQRLRMKFVSEVFVCGSLSNIGVMATAIDAGSHGLDIGIVEDCCGYRDKDRHSGALKRVQEMTGCEILSTDQILNRLKPKPKVQRMAAPIPNPTGRRYPVVYESSPAGSNETVETKESNESKPSAEPAKLESSMAKMSLVDEVDSSLPPITFTRARVAVRGGPSRPLPDIEKRLNEQFNIRGSMNANPNDDLNANSGDESPIEEPPKVSSTAQPQTNAQTRRQENNAEKTQAIVVLTDPIKADGDGAALKESKSKVGERNHPAGFSRPLGHDPGSLEKGTAPIAAMSTPAENASVHKSAKLPLEKGKDTQDIGAMDPNTNTTEGEALCEGDTKVFYNVLPRPLSENIFDMIRTEVDWQRMSHQGGEVPRLVAVQGEVDAEGNIPVYRHPADESPPLCPWTAAVKTIKDVVEQKVGHPLNHALIQFYRDGNDYISEHSDKTLDIAKNSFIVNVSLGAERTMVLRTKRPPKSKDAPQPEPAVEGTKREVQRARLPHNSMCRMGLQTNMRWLHAIRQDKRLDREKSEGELAYSGARISLTFRQIGTFLDREQKVIWGQGAKGKTKEEAHEVINGQTPDAIKMLQAFGRENQSTEFNWGEYYGGGFDVLHISAASRLFTSSDAVANMRVQLMLAELGVGYARGSSAPVSTSRSSLGERRVSDDVPIKLVDNDADKSTIKGDVAIMMYLDQYYGKHEKVDRITRADVARAFTRFQEALSFGDRRLTLEHTSLSKYLDHWEAYAGKADFIAGSTIGIADFAFWPVLYNIMDGSWKLPSHPNLKAYFIRLRNRDTVIKVFGKDTETTCQETVDHMAEGTDEAGQRVLKEPVVQKHAASEKNLGQNSGGRKPSETTASEEKPIGQEAFESEE
ncbi:putative Fe2OG dioxygenase domain-containing protein [Seiridium cardinale]|uniref:Fe2OG dioxygenase domain-containing protein n=1 Tax=Seiridium cardinale TaxID=138064 RepID=A0ABR2XLP6_9PEZI